jgi:hypothetical protein
MESFVWTGVSTGDKQDQKVVSTSNKRIKQEDGRQWRSSWKIEETVALARLRVSVGMTLTALRAPFAFPAFLRDGLPTLQHTIIRKRSSRHEDLEVGYVHVYSRSQECTRQGIRDPGT